MGYKILIIIVLFVILKPARRWGDMFKNLFKPTKKEINIVKLAQEYDAC